MLAAVLLELARVEHGRGHLPEAEAAARRAVAVRTGIDGLVLASAHFELAQILGAYDPSAARAEADLADGWLRDRSTLPLARKAAEWRSRQKR
jgi:hypothetical protein